MKKTILSVLSFAAFFASAELRAEEGDIYEVAACTETGEDILEASYPLWPAGTTEASTPGETLYFRVRLYSPDNVTYWELKHYGPGEALDWAISPPQICLFVSGEERWASLTRTAYKEINGRKFTDLVFSYTTRPGDFALPIVLGARVGTQIKPALDPLVTAPEYALDMKGDKWSVEYDLGGGDWALAKWWICSTGKGVPRIMDASLVNAGFNVQTVDFDSEWETNNVVWRSVHQDTTITIGALPKIVRKSAANEAVSLYVWSTNENAVVVTGPDVEEVESDPENHPGVKFHVAKVTIGASPAENATGSFTLKGVSQTSEDGWSGLVLSPYKQFNARNTLGEYYDDYITVPVRCVDPLPPSVMVKAEETVAYATSDYKVAATRIKVSLTQPVGETFKVRLAPAFTEDNVALDPSVWGAYVRFSTTQDAVDALPAADPATTEVELGGSVTEAYVWLYALRGDEHTGGAVNAMEFQAVAVGTPPAEIVAFNKGACQIVAQDPAILEPLDGDTVEGIQFDETPVTIKVAGSYADDASEEGYEIFVKYNPSDTEHASGAPSGFKKLDGTYKPGDGGTLERCDDGSGDLPRFIWDTVGEYETLVYLVAPVSQKKSCGTDAAYLKLNANITPTKSVKAYTTDERSEFNEGEQADLKLELSENTKVDLYAFLKIENDDVSAEQFSSGSPYVIGMTNRNGKCLGVKVGRGKGSAASPVTLPKLKFLDGYGPATGEYLGVDFTVVLATVQDYDQATNQNKIVKGYESDTLSLVINNVEPRVNYMMLGGFDSEKESGYEYTFKLPMNQEQTLQAVVKDPSNYDLDHDFECQWVISTSNTRNGAYTQRKKIETTGNPEDVISSYNFPYKGWTRIALKVKDKDMDEWPDDAFETYVEVLDKPTITVEPLDDIPLETDKTSVKFGLTYFDSPIPLVMKITVAPGNAGETGELVLDEQYLQAPLGYEGYMAPNTYFLSFSDDLPQDITVIRMDGTVTSEVSGFFLRTEILNEEVNPKTGDRWCDYYVPNLSTRVYPYNVAPNKGDESITFSPDSNPTSRWEIAGGTATTHPLTWRIRSDVEKDFASGITVSVLGGVNNTSVKYYEPTTGTVIPDFGSSQGDQEITITIEDKDGARVSRTWYFTVTPSKFLTTVAHGPSSGMTTVKASSKYIGASGIGQGHIYAASPAKFDSAEFFGLKWNCSSATEVPVYAWGYKMAYPVEGALNDSKDQPVDVNGAAVGTTPVTNPYVYTDENYRDSFFYAWIKRLWDNNAQQQSDGTTAQATYEVVIAPEQSEVKATMGSASLPTTKGANATANAAWPETQLEAIFAREWLWSDNMGDINFDRIPDLYFNKYKFVQENEQVNVNTGVASTEESEIDDLASVASYNDDEDYLPGNLAAATLGYKIPEAFSAEMEIRGFGPALNNAPQLAGVTGARPEIRYTNPDNDSTILTNCSTLTKLEYLAWCDFAAAHGIADPDDPASWYDGASGQLLWSPERPSRPDMADSDEDGFPDGIEYWYWYRAHVGYFDADGVHRYQTGRRFDPRNPGQGTVITSAEIEAAMDPINPSTVNAKYQDSDNDGLIDLIEIKLGTDPFDFDSDGDGLPDGWEVVVSCTDPLGVVSDAALNLDGDAMAISSAALEALQMPTPVYIKPLQVFAVVSATGDSDGVQWYATTNETAIAVEESTETFNVVTTEDGRKYATRDEVFKSVNDTLGKALTADATFLLSDDDVVTLPAYLPMGTKIESVESKECRVCLLAQAFTEAELNTCWVYGRDKGKDARLGELNTAAAAAGFLALGRNQELSVEDPKPQLACLPTNTIDVAYLHYLAYQEYGFDARTAWKSTSPLASRWSIPSKGSGEFEGMINNGQGGYAALPARTRAYTAYDEFLVMSFFLNNGTLDDADDAVPTETNPWSVIWSKYTTNPCGPGQSPYVPKFAEDGEDGEETADEQPAAQINENGADTDGDGVPDGWELYVMAGPKKDGAYVFAPPFAGFTTAGGEAAKSYFSPFVPDAQSNNTDHPGVIGQSAYDGLTQFREFGGTDTVAYYASVSSNLTAGATIVRAAEDVNWLNKFFPTDPWSGDTDGDGVLDGDERTSFAYGTPADDGKLWSIPGGGLNPCSVDTDLDGLPDGWEKQFKGSTVYAGEDAHYAGGTAAFGNPLEGYVDGMDGTVPDAMTVAKTGNGQSVTTHSFVTPDGRVWSGNVNRDYDRDGLENWQEYLTGTMRCWRYDDPISRWSAIPSELYWSTADGVPTWSPDFEALGVADEEEFWKETLFNPSSPIYNPHLITDVNGAQYFSRVTNVWDIAYCDGFLDANYEGGVYYWFKDRVGGTKLGDLWSEAYGDLGFSGPSKYACCSPINPDSDKDGMDDYYELFHGMNPLLGASGVLSSSEAPCDLIADAYAAGEKITIQAWGDSANYWLVGEGRASRAPRGNTYDFVAYPWLNGIVTADPDGDDIRNQDEAIMPMLATTTWQHTDPTPLWMTDSSYSNSLVNLYFRMPTRYGQVPITNESFEIDGVVRYVRDCDGYLPPEKGLLADVPPRIGTFLPDFWKLSADGEKNWLYSFEENEGFDSDHDILNDRDEANGKFSSESDPLDFDQPRRRQAMWFPGANAVLQTLPEVREAYPAATLTYTEDPSFMQFTVECWVCPEESMLGTADTDYYVMVERPIWTEVAKPADEEYIRRNFQLAIRRGKWSAKFDPSGTLADTETVATSTESATNAWTHLAATFDGKSLKLYVNGEAVAEQVSDLHPEYGANARVGSSRDTGDYYGKTSRVFNYQAILIGASLKSQSEYHPMAGQPLDMNYAVGRALDLTQGYGWDFYTRFFHGYIDEVRIWDGARSQSDIKATMNRRLTKEDAMANRSEFFSQWSKIAPAYPEYPQGRRRYVKDANGVDCVVVPELRYHYAFDSVASAQNENMLARAPHGFDSNAAALSRPDDYVVGWWHDVIFGADGRPGYTGMETLGDARWVPWVPNTVSHLPRFDGTTLDSVFWSRDFRGDESGTFTFANTAEPVSLWTQVKLNGIFTKGYYMTTSSRQWFTMSQAVGASNSNLSVVFDFTGRHLNQSGDDLIPLGGVYAKYTDQTVGMWDVKSPSSYHEITGPDSDGDGLPDWWEELALEDYAQAGATQVGWDTLVDYRGAKIPAYQAYFRDMGRGYYADENGKAVKNDESYRQTAEQDKTGVPGWWMDAYGISGESGLDDHDNDGLPNYVEYMLSEVFDFGVNFDPTKARSIDEYTLDYFYPIGSLYAGEMFTDHDLVEDKWEDQYAVLYSSRVDYDPSRDYDEDGWSNRSEARYSGLCRPILASSAAEYPVPTLELKVRYNGSAQSEVETAPLVVQVHSDLTMCKAPSAVFNIRGAKSTATEGEAQEGDDVSICPIGKWSDRRMVGTLTPGRIDYSSLKLRFRYDQSAETCRWYVGTDTAMVYSGTRAEYDEFKLRNAGATVTLLSAPSDYAELSNESIGVSVSGETATLRLSDGVVLGTVNLTTGEYVLDLGKLADLKTKVDGEPVFMQDQTFQLAYKYTPPSGLPRTLYLSEPSSGHVREGVNKVVVWSETIAANGVWDPGEPFGVATDVDISWYRRALEVNLTDTHAVFARVKLDGTGGNDRSYWYGSESGNTTNGCSGALSGGRLERVRVVRYMINGYDYSSVKDMDLFNKVVMDKMIDLNVKDNLNEGDFISDLSPDIDWDELASDLSKTILNATNVAYRIVLGNGEINNTMSLTNAVNVDIHRFYDYERQIPKAVAPGLTSERTLTAPNPTFVWTVDGTKTTYTAFRIVVSDEKGNEVWNSGLRRTPPIDGEGNYRWSAPLFVGDRGTSGRVFENGAKYSWKVSMYNAKFRTDSFSTQKPLFMMNVQTNGNDYANADVAVKYYGPKETYKSKVIRVRAYATPDFSGNPIAAGFVTNADDAAVGVGVTGKVIRANCKVIGIPRGTFYLQAFIDSNANGKCDSWETMGYLWNTDATGVDRFNPQAVSTAELGKSGRPLIVYLEDADTDNDGLPDAWEYAHYGSLTKKNVENVTESGTVVLNPNLLSTLSLMANTARPCAALAQRTQEVLNNAGTMALALNAPIGDETQRFAAAIASSVSEELVDQGVQITSLGFDLNGNVRVSVDAEVRPAGGSTVGGALRGSGNGTVRVTCLLYRKDSLTDAEWTKVGSVGGIPVGDGPVSITVENSATSAPAGFYQVRLEKE